MAAEQSEMIEQLGNAAESEAASDIPRETSEPVESKEQPAEKVVVDPAKPDDSKTAEKLVPLKALQEEREQAKELKRHIKELQDQPKLSAEDAELLKDLKAQRQKHQAPTEPDFIEDPKGYVDATVSAALKKLEAADSKIQKIENAATQQQQLQALVGAVQAHEGTYSKEQPDYFDALTHLRTVRNNQLKLLYPQATEQQIGQAIMQEELQTAAQIIRAGGNPAQFAYSYAKTLGYQLKAPVTTEAEAKPAVSKDAARSLGGNGAVDKDASEGDDKMPEFTAALSERFGRKKR